MQAGRRALERPLAAKAAGGGRRKHLILATPKDIGKDGIVRYVVVATSATGAVNAMYEGLRCDRAVLRVERVARGEHLVAQHTLGVVQRRAGERIGTSWRDFPAIVSDNGLNGSTELPISARAGHFGPEFVREATCPQRRPRVGLVPCHRSAGLSLGAISDTDHRAKSAKVALRPP